MADEEIVLPTGGVNPPTAPTNPSKTVDLSNRLHGETADLILDEITKMKEDDFIPWEEVTLPSRGFYYGDKLPGGVVRVRGMGIHADKILATQRLAQSGQSIDYLFKHCVDLPVGFDPADLLSGDRTFLLYYLRGITHGNNYEFVMKCPNCESSAIQKYDLNELAGTISGPKPELGNEPFKVTLPYLSEVTKRTMWVKIRLMRGKDVSAIANRQKFNKRLHGMTNRKERSVVIDESVTENIALIIVAFGSEGAEGEARDPMKIKTLVDKLHSRDTATIRQFLRENSPGIDTQIEVTCPDCGNQYITDLPITESFFRPTGTGEPG